MILGRSKACECCGRRFSTRGAWLPDQMVSTGPTTSRLAYCRRCMFLGSEVERLRAHGRLLRAACERVAPDGSIRATEILAVLDSRRWS